jgi:hypothetical protein
MVAPITSLTPSATRRFDRWAVEPAPLDPLRVAVAGRDVAHLAVRYAPGSISSTNGHCRGFLITEVALALQPDQRVLYLGDWD